MEQQAAALVKRRDSTLARSQELHEVAQAVAAERARGEALESAEAQAAATKLAVGQDAFERRASDLQSELARRRVEIEELRKDESTLEALNAGLQQEVWPCQDIESLKH